MHNAQVHVENLKKDITIRQKNSYDNIIPWEFFSLFYSILYLFNLDLVIFLKVY